MSETKPFTCVRCGAESKPHPLDPVNLENLCYACCVKAHQLTMFDPAAPKPPKPSRSYKTPRAYRE